MNNKLLAIPAALAMISLAVCLPIGTYLKSRNDYNHVLAMRGQQAAQERGADALERMAAMEGHHPVVRHPTRDELAILADKAARETSAKLCSEGKVPKELRSLECGDEVRR